METFWSVIAGGLISIATTWLTTKADLSGRRQEREDNRVAAQTRAQEEQGEELKRERRRIQTAQQIAENNFLYVASEVVTFVHASEAAVTDRKRVIDSSLMDRYQRSLADSALKATMAAGERGDTDLVATLQGLNDLVRALLDQFTYMNSNDGSGMLMRSPEHVMAEINKTRDRLTRDRWQTGVVLVEATNAGHDDEHARADSTDSN